jgi:hypothetical protein
MPTFQLMKGCKVFYSGWTHGYLWVADIYDNGYMMRCVDDKGVTKFTALRPMDVSHVGMNHAKCLGERIIDNG